MRRATALKLFGTCSVSFLLSQLPADAQTITGSVRGTVTDPSGAVVSGAEVSITNVDTGVVTKTVSDRTGLYGVQFLTIGNYTVSISASGFQTTSEGPFTLQIDQIAKINLQLHVGSASSTVTVASDASPVLNTENATLGTSISSNTLQNMPLNGLNVNFATLFVPGAVNPSVAQMGGLQGSYRNTSEVGIPSFNGTRKQGNNFILDGVEINETIASTSGYNPSPYSLQEVRIITGNADAEYGNVTGGEVIMVTKGGTNRFHGSAFEYYKNQNLAANSWDNNFNGTQKGKFTQHQFGGSIGGPILRDKLFFFADYEGLQYNIPPSQSLASVPDTLERQGNFSELLTVPATPVQLYNTSAGTDAATEYTGNVVPINNPVAKYLFAHPEALPLPNHTPIAGTVAQANYVGYTAQKNINNQVDGRLDYTVGTHDTLMLKGTYGDAHDLQSQTPLPVIFPLTNDYPFYMGVINWTHTFNSSLLNQARAGYSRVVQSQGVTDNTGLFGNNGDAVVGIPLQNQSIAGFTQISIGGSDIGGFGTGNSPGGIAIDNNFDYGDNLTWVHGHHITKFGAQLVRYQENYFSPGNLGGLLGGFSYTGVFTSAGSSVGDGFADFELDDAQTALKSGQSGPFGIRQWRDAVYFQDDWKLFPNLTLNIGLRYGYDQQPIEANDKMVSVDLQKAYFAPAGTAVDSLLRFAGKNGNNRSLINPYYEQFMPRVGFAWQLNPGLVIRGGYSITDDEEGTGSGLRMTQNAPFLTSFTSNGVTPSPTSGGLALHAGDGFVSATPGATTSQYDVWDPNFRPASVQQFNLTTQFQLFSRTSAQLGYVGEIGQHLEVPVLGNQYIGPVPTSCPGDTTGCVDLVAPYYSLVGTNQIAETTSRGIENYHALQATLRQQETNGLEFTLNYTWAKSMSNNPGGFFNVGGTLAGLYQFWQNAYNPHQDYGNSAFDAPNNFSGTIIYRLPFGHGKQFGSSWNRLTDEALGGWQLAGNVLLTSGFPISIYQNPNDNLNTAADSFNYNGYATVNKYFEPRIVNRSAMHWFGTDPSATPCTTPGARINKLGALCGYGLVAFNQFGTSQPNTERAPGSRDVDLSVFKSFRTIKEQNFKLRVDAFNAFNMVSLGTPSARIGRSNFGQITNSLGAPRQFQLSLLYEF